MRIVRLILAVVITSAMAALSFGDGLFFEEGAINGSSSIPHQRAIIAHKDGKELMIVESTLRGKQGNYAWIVPVPSVPTTIERIYDDLFDSLNLQLKPQVNSFLRYPNRTLWGYGVLLTVVSLLAAYRIRVRKSTYAKSLLELGLLTFVGAVAVFSLRDLNNLEWYYPVSATGAEGASVLSSGEVGNYSYVVLGAKNGDDAASWLNGHGYRIPEASKKALAAYASKGWKFFAARLKHGKEDQSHPVLLEFMTKEPVYPMALTATGKPPLDLDLYLFGRGNASVRGMRFIASTNVSIDSYYNEETKKDEPYINPIDHVKLRPYLVDGQIVTRLHGHYETAIPPRDFSIRFSGNTQCYQAVMTTPRAALLNASGCGLLIYSCILLVASIALLWHRHALPILAAVALISAGVLATRAVNEYQTTPKSTYNMN